MSATASDGPRSALVASASRLRSTDARSASDQCSRVERTDSTSHYTAQRVALAGDRSRYGVVQAITEVARTKNADPNVRFAMERAAGRYLVAA